MQKRILMLESRINQLENRLAKRPAVERQATSSPRRAARRSGARPVPSDQDKDAEAAAQPTASAGEPAASRGPSVPQETFLVRDTVPTLARNRWEASQAFEYGRTSNMIQNDRWFRSITTLRYGFGGDSEVSVGLPVMATTRNTQTGVKTIHENVLGVGDVSAQLTKTVLPERNGLPGVALNVGFSAPTGPSPYATTLQPGGYPGDPLKLVMAGGHWTTRGGVQFFKTADPLILFAGAGLEYAFARKFSGYKIQPGLRFTYNLGFGFALSEFSTLGFTVNGTLQQHIKVAGVTVKDSFGENVNARFSLIQRIGPDFWVEPSLTVGLTKDSPDVAVGVALRKRF